MFPECIQPTTSRRSLRFTLLLGACSLGTGLVLAGSQALLLQLPRPTPQTEGWQLALEQRWALNPQRRREAALLRASPIASDPAQQLQLLGHQAWGRDPLAAVVLKQQALAAAALGDQRRSQALWEQLLARFPNDPASADALYALGRQQPGLHRLLWQRFAAHPAALAAAAETDGLAASLHLARWGARWPGAASRLEAACRNPQTPASARQQLGQGLAEIGAIPNALRCLQGQPANPATGLLIAASELQGNPAEHTRGLQRLLQLVQRQPSAPQAEAAVRLLGEQGGGEALNTLRALPSRWQTSAPVQAALALANPQLAASLGVLQRWPTDAASWELQWQRARRAALAGHWAEARAVLEAGGPALQGAMPMALEARRRFWLGLSLWQLGQPVEARQQWTTLLRQHPGGYYGWRAATRLNRLEPADGAATPAPALTSPALTSTALTSRAFAAERAWWPLHSGDRQVDRLWRLNQPLEAWEQWRNGRRGQPPSASRTLLAEGRLREAIGDGWTGLGQQELAALRLKPKECPLQPLIQRSLHRPRRLADLAPAARRENVPLALLLGVALQESRFQSTARSVVGASGLLQLMPETAAEVAGRPLAAAELDNPARNAQLGSRYLRQLLQRWGGNALLAVASYNAGPGAVASWPALQRQLPEVWVEAIPYPETRHYVKKVLGNSWSFSSNLARGRSGECP